MHSLLVTELEFHMYLVYFITNLSKEMLFGQINK